MLWDRNILGLWPIASIQSRRWMLHICVVRDCGKLQRLRFTTTIFHGAKIIVLYLSRNWWTWWTKNKNEMSARVQETRLMFLLKQISSQNLRTAGSQPASESGVAAKWYLNRGISKCTFRLCCWVLWLSLPLQLRLRIQIRHWTRT